MKKPDVESDSLAQQVYIRLAKIRDEAPTGARLKQSQTAGDGEARLPRDAAHLPLVQQDEVGWQTLGQKDGAALARTEAPTRQFQ